MDTKRLLENNELFTYFESPSDFAKLKSRGYGQNILAGKCLENFSWESNSVKTLVCHDFLGGYLPYERYIMNFYFT